MQKSKKEAVLVSHCSKMGRNSLGRTEQFMKKLIANRVLYWNAACQFDDIAPGSGCVVFSEDNPYVPLYNQAVIAFMDAVRNPQKTYINL
jgi:hypothetical protein